MSTDQFVVGALMVAALILAAVASALGPLWGTLLVGVPVAGGITVVTLRNADSPGRTS